MAALSHMHRWGLHPWEEVRVLSIHPCDHLSPESSPIL